MNDIDVEWNGDISFGPTGDIAIASGHQLISQRLCRRLLTNVGDYLWQLAYGASLGQFVGTPVDVNAIEAVIRSQIQLEPTFLNTSTADVSVSMTNSGNGIISANILYADPTSPSPIAVNINVPRDMF